jgi:phosphodiesterase/alkaline phosphatase D-like protein
VGGLVALAVIGGIVYYASDVSGPTATTTPPSATPTPSPGATPQPAAPVAVTSSSIVAFETAASVTGTVSPRGAFTTYWYEYGLSANLGLKTPNQNIGSSFATIAAPGYITGLTKDTTYYFRLVAENQFGRSNGATQSFHTNIGVPPPSGGAPSVRTLVASGVSRTGADLNGDVDPNRAATQFWFEYGTTANLGFATALSGAGSGDERVAQSVSLTGLQPATTYYFRINAQNQFGTVNGAILNFTTLGPPAPSAPSATTRSATDVATSTATLRGTVDPNGAETKYWFEYSTDSLLGSILIRTTARTSAGAGNNAVQVETDVSGLQSDTTYFFRIVAENSAGTARGEKMSFTTR